MAKTAMRAAGKTERKTKTEAEGHASAFIRGAGIAVGTAGGVIGFGLVWFTLAQALSNGVGPAEANFQVQPPASIDLVAGAGTWSTEEVRAHGRVEEKPLAGGRLQRAASESVQDWSFDGGRPPIIRRSHAG